MSVSEKQKEASKKWYDLHKEEISAKRHGNRKEEHVKSYQRKIEIYGREELARQAREQRKKDPQAARDRLNKYRKENPEKKLWSAARTRCNKSGMEFTITKDDIIIPEYCPILGVKLVSSNKYGRDFCPSLDRIDNSRGYTKDNIWIISFKANRMKNTATKQELISFAKGILNVFNAELGVV